MPRLPDPSIPTIVVVDGDRASRESLRDALVDTCADIHAFASAKPALAKMSALAREGHSPFLVIAALRMDGMGGLAFLREAKSIDARALRALTGADSLDAKDILALHELGVWRLLAKPWTAAGLCEMADQALAEHEGAAPAPLPGQAAPERSPPLGPPDAIRALGSMVGMVDQLPIGICMVDASMRLRVLNAAAKAMLGLPESLFASGLPPLPLLTARVAASLAPGEAAPCEMRMMALAAKREPQRFEQRLAGGPLLDVQGIPMPDGGFLVLWTDITAQRDAEARAALRAAKLEEMNKEWGAINQELADAHRQMVQSEKMASIGQLAAGVAHEINNPIGFVGSNLATIGGYAEELLRVAEAVPAALARMPACEERDRLASAVEATDLPWLIEDIPPLISESRDGVERVRKIVQDLKDFSRPESSEANWELSDMVRCIRSTLSIAKNEIKYCASVEDLLPQSLEVECLPSSLNQVFLNFLVNSAHAIEAKGAGMGTIKVGAGSDGGKAWFEFSDDGCGMSEEVAGKVFDPFFTTKPVGKGTGLGLSIAHGIVERHRGTISVKSTPGEGTLFRIEIPLRQSAPPGAEPIGPPS